MKVAGARVLVTGASRGIGAATATELARRGANLAVAARTREALEEVARECRDLGAEVHVIIADMAEEAQVRAMVAEADAVLGGVDVLVNNAGLGLADPVAEIKPADLRYVFEVNVMAPHVATLAALPGMLSRRRGRIINVGSVASHISTPNLGGYSATKFALKALTDALRMELQGTGVGATLICPGPIATDFVVNSKGEVEGRLPTKPLGAPAVDVARAVARAISRGSAELFIPAYYQAVVGANSIAPQVLRFAGKPGMKAATRLAEKFL
ncbi:MAG: SDR family NAD(P)-dependent oxidoreductase [Candidatus Dormibacteraeota bacterium]|nr:SDR family NAD(P)-dependent oxidoreductase [Candidatus Dormibacteraeota bacterium]